MVVCAKGGGEVSKVSIVRQTSDHEDFRGLVRLLDTDLTARYGAAQAEYDPLNASHQPLPQARLSEDRVLWAVWGQAPERLL